MDNRSEVRERARRWTCSWLVKIPPCYVLAVVTSDGWGRSVIDVCRMTLSQCKPTRLAGWFVGERGDHGGQG